MDPISLIVGFIIGLIGNVVFVAWQYKHSIAFYRAKQVQQAIIDFTDLQEGRKPETNTSALTNKYRMALGVIIDDLVQMAEDGKKKGDKYPLLVACPGADTWQRFNEYVRPVMNDLSSYAFLPFVVRLHLVYKLCFVIEQIVSSIDADYVSPKKVVLCDGEGIAFIVQYENSPEAQDIKRLYQELYSTFLKLKYENRFGTLYYLFYVLKRKN